MFFELHEFAYIFVINRLLLWKYSDAIFFAFIARFYLESCPEYDELCLLFDE